MGLVSAVWGCWGSQAPSSADSSISHPQPATSVSKVSRGSRKSGPVRGIAGLEALCNLMKLQVMLCRATQDGCVIVESSNKMWFTGEGNGKHLQYSCPENPMNSMKRQKDGTLKDEFPRSAQYVPGDQWRNSTRKNEEMESKQKQHPVVDMTGDESKVQCCKEH